MLYTAERLAAAEALAVEPKFNIILAETVAMTITIHRHNIIMYVCRRRIERRKTHTHSRA